MSILIFAYLKRRRHPTKGMKFLAKDIQMVFLDIDGTLAHRGKLVRSAIESVKKLIKTGMPVAVCTGRSRLHATEVLDTLGISMAVFFNGGLVEKDGEILHANPLSEATVTKMMDFFEQEDIPLILHTRTNAVSLHPLPQSLNSVLEAYDFPKVARTTRDEWRNGESATYQANMFCSRDWDTTIQNLLPECLLYRWEEDGADLQQRNCDKAEGAKYLLSKLGISPAHALHIGDGGNDVGLFNLLGMSVAMGNAHEEVKRHAKMTTATVTDDGVQQALTHLGLI